jgi:hypothetical protein
MGTSCQHHAPAALPTESLGTHGIGGWLELRVGLEGCLKSRTNRDLIPGPSSTERVATPPEISWSCNSMGIGDIAAEV